MPLPDDLIEAAAELRDATGTLRFTAPVTHVYHPLEYAWAAHELYLRRFGATTGRVVFLGMNPGPWGMAQTGVPFGAVEVVRDWLDLAAPIGRPDREHPKRPIDGLGCRRSEVSGRRLWGLFRDRFETPDRFFARHFVANYCPLVFMEPSGRNRTPDKLPVAERDALHAICDAHLRRSLDLLQPERIIAVGVYAEKRLLIGCPDLAGRVIRILHPSPASPAGNRDWAGTVTRQLRHAGVW